MFNQQEVQILLGGVNSPVDLDDLHRHTNYSGVYDDAEDTITAFWNEPRRALLRFVTSCSQPPLLSSYRILPFVMPVKMNNYQPQALVSIYSSFRDTKMSGYSATSCSKLYTLARAYGIPSSLTHLEHTSYSANDRSHLLSV